MRVVIQRVSEASVAVQGRAVGSIGRGVVALVGVGHGDGDNEAKWLADKTAQLRIFPDDQGKMNRCLADIGGAALVISQFTLLGDCRKGRRPSFIGAAEPDVAQQIYDRYADHLKQSGIPVETGVFAADMKVRLINDGPVTLILDRSPSSG